MNPPRDLMHDEEKTTSPKHPNMATTFDRLIESNLELQASVKELTAEVRALVRALTEGKDT